MMWELKLAKRPPVDQEKLAFNKKLTEILGGNLALLMSWTDVENCETEL
jgi:hypothetical protein